MPRVSWRALIMNIGQQMGADYARPQDFVRAAKRELQKLAKLYPEARYSFPHGGIRILDGSLPSVGKKLLEA